MSSRGPDGSGEWFSNDGCFGLGHRRLSIIDLSDQGAQPMQSADGKLIVVFNGEIYNYRSLRSELETKGYVFRTQSDTEVLIHLYAATGREMVHHLRGMFAFGIVDLENRAVLLARDPYGIKPLYYADDGQTLRFASQVRALLAGGQISRDPDAAGWVGFHLFGSVPDPLTTYRHIRALPAGTTILATAEGVGESSPYFRISEVYRNAEARSFSGADIQDCVKAALSDSVRHHMVADVPVGIFLSAGIDSGALLGLMRDNGQQNIEAVTLAYEEFRDQHRDEAPLAARCAHHYRSNHHVRVVTEEEFRTDLPKIFDAMDQPTIDGINTWFVSKAAGEMGLKAAISGLGGDELLGGYPSFGLVPRLVQLLAVPARIPLFDEIFRQFVVRSGLASILNPKVSGLLRYGRGYASAYFLQRGLFMPWELESLMDKAVVAEGLRRIHPVEYVSAALEPAPHTAFAKVASLESSIYMRNQLLRDTDWASMAHSLEVRVPLVDASLLRTIAPATVTMRNGDGKKYLAASPRKPLPIEIADRAKTGFQTPIELWLQRDQRLQAWRRVPALAKRHCPWARRWAYTSAAA
jgi:asparagine synthase (glutamine-hydrolysing)